MFKIGDRVREKNGSCVGEVISIISTGPVDEPLEIIYYWVEEDGTQKELPFPPDALEKE